MRVVWHIFKGGPTEEEAVVSREQLLENLIARFIRAQEIDRLEVTRMILCGCDSCLLLTVMFAEVEHVIKDMPPSGARVN